MYSLESYESLPPLEPDWLQAVRSHPLLNYSKIIIAALSLLPVFLLSVWWQLGRLEKKQVG
jgi:hypothetical protein